MATSSKKQKISGSNVDWISKLPDSLLCEILSFLPIKLVVATCVLSKRWRFLWTSVPTLDFSGHNYSPDIAHIVNRVLVLRREWCIQRFSVSTAWDNCDSFTIHSWISAAIARNVQELDLEISEQVALPHSLYNSKTLSVLKLTGGGQAMDVPSYAHLPNLKILYLKKLRFKDEDSSYNLFLACPLLQELDFTGMYHWRKNPVKFHYTTLDCFQKLVILVLCEDIVWNVASNVHFPCLKILHLECIIYKDKNYARNLFSGCPVLEDLYVGRFHSDNMPNYEISSPTLLRLEVDFPWDNSIMNSYTLRVNTPALEYLRLDDGATQRFYIKSMGSLVEATVCNCIDFNVFQALSNVTYLHLERHEFKPICNMNFFDNKLPEFHNLVELTLEKFCCRVVLMHMLQKFPCLECLTLTYKLSPGYKLREHEEACRIPTAMQPQHVPNCLARHLKTISFSEFGGLDVEMEFMRYILKHSLVLEDVKIRAESFMSNRSIRLAKKAERIISNRRFAVLQKLAAFERGSEKCQLCFE